MKEFWWVSSSLVWYRRFFFQMTWVWFGLLHSSSVWIRTLLKLLKLDAVPPEDVLDKGDLQGGVKLVKISSNNIWNNFC